MTKHFPLTSFIALLAVAILVCPVCAESDGNIAVQIIPERITQGDAVLVKISSSDPLHSIQAKFRGKTFSFYREGDGIVFSSVLGMDLNESPGEKTLMLNITYSNGHVSQLPVRFTVIKKDFPVQRLTLPSSMVFLSPENLARVKREKAVLERLWDSSAQKKEWTGRFIMPVRGSLISPFGVRRIINNERRSPHTGIDLRAEAGTPVLASSDGIVVMTSELFFAGKSVFIDHGMGIFTMYFHLSEIYVEKGERVALGQIIGRVGQTGRATGPHLHWGVRILDSRIDPLSLLNLFKEG